MGQILTCYSKNQNCKDEDQVQWKNGGVEHGNRFGLRWFEIVMDQRVDFAISRGAEAVQSVKKILSWKR